MSVDVAATVLLAFVGLYPVVSAGLWIGGALVFRLFDERTEAEQPPDGWPGVTVLISAYNEEEVILDRSDNPIQETARNLGPALLVVTFDAVFAFAALRFSKVPMIRQFGLLLAVGIVVICVTSIVAPLAVLGIREYRSPTHGRDFRDRDLPFVRGRLDRTSRDDLFPQHDEPPF